MRRYRNGWAQYKDNPNHYYHYVYQQRVNRIFAASLLLMIAAFITSTMGLLSLGKFIGYSILIAVCIAIALAFLAVLFDMVITIIEWIWADY